MKEEKIRPKTIDEYIALQPVLLQENLIKLHSIIMKNAPGAEEVISYGMPAFKLNGMLVYFAGFTKHYSLFAMPGAIKKFKIQLKNYKTSAGTIQFPIDKPLPVKLVTDIIKFRVQENLEKARVKMKAAKEAKAKKR